jgi:2-C-methyl-D-erythritol 4-phosphate cytidylyltransferase
LFKTSDFPVSVVEGASTRQGSVVNSLNAAGDFDYVMIHDAVRCCISLADIRRIRKALPVYKACALGVRVKDTIKKADANGKIVATVDRNNLWQIQTPQCFALDIIKYAHNKAFEEGFEVTDDCQVVELNGGVVKIVPSLAPNFKITTVEDLQIAAALLK